MRLLLYPLKLCAHFLRSKLITTKSETEKMEGKITHRTVKVNGINMHVAEKGKSGPVILFVHGFPELWYTWRHQIRSLAALGYRCVAPDMRGYGETDSPTDSTAYSIMHLVGDLVALIDSLSKEQVFVVAHDWGALVAWSLCQFRPDKVKAFVALSVVYLPRNPTVKTLDSLRAAYGDEYYMCRFQEPGRAESEFARLSTDLVLRKFFTYRTPGPLYMPKEGWGNADDKIALPDWLSEDEFGYFVDKFDKTGFTGGLNYYRCLNLNWELLAPWTGATVNVPTKFIVGDLDLSYHIPRVKEFIQSGSVRKFVPVLDEVVVMEGVGHFIQEEKPEEISNCIHAYFQKFKSGL